MSSATTTAAKALEKIRKSAEALAEKIDNRLPKQFPDAASPGDFIRQGDLYIHLLPEDLAASGLELLPCKCERQLAPGNTQGSRHILDRDVTMYKVKHGDELQGPVFRTTEKTTVDHPEHAAWILPADCNFSVTYQRIYAEELRRVQD